MKKIFTIQRREGRYYGYYRNPNRINENIQYDFIRLHPLDLIYQTLEFDNLIPLFLFDWKPHQTSIPTQSLTARVLDDNILRIISTENKTKYVDIDLQNYKDIWEKYKHYINNDADEITLEDDNGHFNIYGEWYDK